MHELNLDWIIGVIREFEKKYPDIVAELEKKINKPIIDPIGNAGSFLMSNGDGSTEWADITEAYAAEITQAVYEWLEEHPEATTTVEDGSITTKKFNKEVYTLPFDYPCNIVAEFPISSIQGGCWVTNNRYVFASPIGNNICKIYEWDQSTNSIIRTANIECYHGNAIAYDPESGFLYIADCLDSNGNELNTVTVVNYSNLAYIRRITAPVTALLSLAYDKETHTFYSTNYRGTTEGQANALYEYNGVFESVKRVIVLDDLTVRYPIHHSNQGVHCVRDGIAYILYYDPSRTIVGFDIETGKKIIIANIPEYINNYKYAGEIEAITYNETTKSYIVFSSGFAFEIGLYKSIPIDRLHFDNILSDSGYPVCHVNIDEDYSTNTQTVIQRQSENIPIFRNIADAIHAAKNLNKAVHIYLNCETPTEYAETVNVEDANFRLAGKMVNGEHYVTLTKPITTRRCIAIISDFKFSSNCSLTSDGACMYLRDSIVYVWDILFQNTNATYDIENHFGSILQTAGNTFVTRVYNAQGSMANITENPLPAIGGYDASLITNIKRNKTLSVYDNETLKGTVSVPCVDVGNIHFYAFNHTFNYTFETMLQIRGFEGLVLGGTIYVNQNGTASNPYYIQPNVATDRLYIRPNVTGENIKLEGYIVVMLGN